MAKLLVAGDWHGNNPHARRVIDAAQSLGSDHIIQVGDFGWWPHIHDGDHDAYAGRVDDYAQKRGVMIDWLDGNHENFDDLETRAHTLDGRGARYYERPNSETGRKLTNVAYLPRGLVFPLDHGRQAMAFGGAYSVDKRYRTPHHSWWPQELPSGREINDALDNARPVDFMFVHDAPEMPPGLMSDWNDDPASENNRAAIHALMDAYQPKVLFHGHYHFPYTSQLRNTQIYGLGADKNMDGSRGRGSVVALDTESGSVEPVM